MLTKLRGYAAQDVCNKTIFEERGLFGYPDNLRKIRNQPSSELNYDEWFAALAAAGVNLIRVRLTGKQTVWARDGQRAASIEPPPAGTFNIWHNVLDPTNLNQYRTDQVPGSIPSHLWRSSNLGQLIDAAEAHGVKLLVSPFESNEFKAPNPWRRHAWNLDNRYLDGTACQAQDQGFVREAWQVFTDARCRDAAKARLDFLLQAVEGHDVVAFWELCEEITWMAAESEFWGLDTWDVRMHANIDKIVDWVNDLATYIKERHSAPVASGHAFGGVKRQFSTDPNDFFNVVNRVHQAEAVDIVSINWYVGEDVAAAHRWLRACQEHFAGKQIVVTQYAPWDIRRTDIYTSESDPFPESKRFEWTAVCGSYGLVGPVRWPGIREQTRNDWLTGGYADPDMANIAGVTSEFAELVDLSQWSGFGESYDARISSSNLSEVAAWGDGTHVTMMLTWPSDGAKTITIKDLKDDDYKFHLYDWLSGTLISTEEVTAAAGSLVLDNVPTTDRSVAAYVEPLRSPPPPAADGIRLVFRDETGQEVGAVELKPDHTYVLDAIAIESTK